jgi:hypothetical protein
MIKIKNYINGGLSDSAIENYISKMSGSGATYTEVADRHYNIMTGSIERLIK